MENEYIEKDEEQQVYQMRPKWQIWAARIALVLFILLLIAYYINISRGGL